MVEGADNQEGEGYTAMSLESFNLTDVSYTESAEKEEHSDDAEYQERAQKLLHLIDQKQNCSPVGVNIAL